jgi:hypothetical protein
MLAPRTAFTLALIVTLCFTQVAFAQNPNFKIFKNFIVTGDYITAGWQEGPNDGKGFATGNIVIPDVVVSGGKQPVQAGVNYSVPKGADIIAAYLYWGTVESSQSAFAGQTAFFNGYKIQGTVLGNPNAPTSWSSGGCSGASNGSKTMRFYRADVRPYLPVDTDSTSLTYGALTAAGQIPLKLADTGSNGNTAPFSLGASLVVVYRQLAPPVPLNSVVLYDGIIAPSNTAQSVSQDMQGIYQAGLDNKLGNLLAAKLTHIVANGQPNKQEAVFLSDLNNLHNPLTSIYGGTTPPFPGIYGNWDNPTWNIGAAGANYVLSGDSHETTSIVPGQSNAGCVSWGAMILSSTVQDTDGDGLIDSWESAQGYTDVVSGNPVTLSGANSSVPDIFVEVDYLSNLDGLVPSLPLHSHLPKRQTLQNVGDILLVQHGINVHFDVGGAYPGAPYVVPNGTGGNGVSESLLYCADGASLCAFPNQPSIGWKGDFQNFQANTSGGNFQTGRGQSYHYLVSGHSIAAPRSFWSSLGAGLNNDPNIPTVVSIVNSGTTATVTLRTPLPAPLDALNSPTGGVIRPGDCPSAVLTACSDLTAGRITIAGSVSPGTIAVPNPDGLTSSFPSQLNGTYSFNPKKVTTTTVGNVTTSTFTITTANVANGTYTFSNDPQLGVLYLGPTSTSGHSDFNGGGDSIMTLGLWGADDAAGCDKDPGDPNATLSTVFCDNGVGTISEQTGTLLHEIGHSLALSHGGTYTGTDPNNPSVLMYDINCKPNFVSVMNYLFQVRGFADGAFDYSLQTLPDLNEAPNFDAASLTEAFGIGPASTLTRWYSNPNAIDQQIQNTSGGGHYAKAHCDGTFKAPSELPAVRVDAVAPTGGALDWNNDLIIPNTVTSTIDLNNNGVLGDLDFLGFNDTPLLNLQQISARAGAFGVSQGGGLQVRGGGLQVRGGGTDGNGAGLQVRGGGLQVRGGGLQARAGGIEQDEDTAHSTVAPPANLICTTPITVGTTTFPGCTVGTTTPGFIETKAITLTWGFPGQVTQSNFGQIRTFNVYRAVDIAGSVLANAKAFVPLKSITPVPPAVAPVSFFVDTTVKNGHAYTYFVTAVNKQGAQSGPSNYLTVTTVTK